MVHSGFHSQWIVTCILWVWLRLQQLSSYGYWSFFGSLFISILLVKYYYYMKWSFEISRFSYCWLLKICMNQVNQLPFPSFHFLLKLSMNWQRQESNSRPYPFYLHKINTKVQAVYSPFLLFIVVVIVLLFVKFAWCISDS